MEEKDGRLPLLIPMSEVAGRMSAIIVADILTKYSGGIGILLGGIAGAGTVGLNAASIAVGLGTNVTILDIDHKRLAEMDDLFYGRVNTILSDRLHMEEEAMNADLFIGAVLMHGKKAPIILTEKCVKSMKKRVCHCLCCNRPGRFG